MRFSAVGVVVAVMAFSSVSCVSRRAHVAQVNKARGLVETLDQMEQYLQQFERENESLRRENSRFQKTAEDAAWVRDQRTKLAKLLADLKQQGGGVAIPGVTAIRGKGGSVGLRIEDSVLFGSGRAEVSTEGKVVLARLLPILTKDDRLVRVEGHTDADPIVRSKWKSNLHLSAARALAVAGVLHAKGMSWAKLHVAGFGPTRPASEVATDKERNRRVELYLD